MLIITFLLGILINAMGYVPPGNINLSVAKLAINKGMRQVWYFIVSFSIVEIFYTFGMMRFARWAMSDINPNEAVGDQVRLSSLVDYFMIAMFLVMGTITWVYRNKVPKTNEKEDKRSGSIVYGMILGVLNPVQIPFWLFFGNYVILHQWIETDYLSLVIFSLGSGLGSTLALYLYAHFAKFIQEKFALSSLLINKSIAIFLYLLAAYLIIKQCIVFFN